MNIRIPHRKNLSERQIETETFMRDLKLLAEAKASENLLLIWEALDDVAAGAIHCETPTIGQRYIAALDAHRAAYRTVGCTSNQFAYLDAFWDLPRRA